MSWFCFSGPGAADHGSATRSYAADFQADGLLAKHRPELLGLPTTNGSYSTGDGHKAIIAIEGAAIDMDKVQVHRES